MQVEIYQETAGGNGKMHYVVSENWTKLSSSEGFAALGTSEKWNKFVADSVSPDVQNLYLLITVHL